MTTIDISVRPAKPKDGPAIANVHADAWRQTYSGVIPGPALNQMISRRDTAWWTRAIRKNPGNIQVISFAGNVAGYASIRRNYPGYRRANSEVCELYLRPEYQGVGLGRRLFAAAVHAAVRKFGEGCIVWALKANEPACRFYQHLGGQEVAIAEEKLGGAELEKVGYYWP